MAAGAEVIEGDERVEYQDEVVVEEEYEYIEGEYPHEVRIVYSFSYSFRNSSKVEKNNMNLSKEKSFTMRMGSNSVPFRLIVYNEFIKKS